MTALTDRQHQVLARHIAALLDDARAMDATAELFKPELDACWERNANGSLGKMLDAERAIQLRELAITSSANAKYNRELADAIYVLMSASGALNNGER